MKTRILLALVFVMIFITACGMNATPPGAAPTPTEKPAAAVAQATATARPTNTPRATRTPKPEPTATVEPTATPVRGKSAEEIEDDVNAIVGSILDKAPEDTVTREEVEDLTEAVVNEVNSAGEDYDLTEVEEAIFARLLESGRLCRSDKVATWAEIQGAGAQRMELSSGEDWAHVDYYNNPEEPTISIILQPGEEAIVAGLGSMWQFPTVWCPTWGVDRAISDAQLYADQWREDNGHSGVVFASLYDALNGGEPVANPRNLSSAEINNLRPVMWDDSEVAPIVDEITGHEPASDPETALACEARPVHFAPVPGTVWEISTDGPAIVNFWSNWENLGTQGEHKIYLTAGTQLALKGGGAVYFYPAGCEEEAERQFGENPQPVWNMGDLAPWIQ